MPLFLTSENYVQRRWSTYMAAWEDVRLAIAVLG